MDKYFLTIADSRMIESSNRIASQAKNLECYKNIFVTNENDLSAQFKKRFSDKLILGSRGFGYYCWKPQIILQALEKIQFGDILQYTDVGCHLNVNGKKRLLEYFYITNKSPKSILAFQLKIPVGSFKHDGRSLPLWKEAEWNKGDLIDFFNVRNNNNILSTPQVESGVIFIKKSIESIRIIKQWRNTIFENFSLIDDSPSLASNIYGFKEHRHDQSIFSLLCKLNGVQTISSFELWYPKRNNFLYKFADWEHLKNYPIHVKRDKKLPLTSSVKWKLNRLIFRLSLILGLFVNN
jgi:hypothetical protein